MQYILSKQGVSFVLNGKPYAIVTESSIFNSVVKSLREGDKKALQETIDLKAKIVADMSASEDIRLEGRSIFYGKREITGLIGERVFQMLDAGMGITPLLNFLKRLMKNPSKRAIDEAFDFIDACNLPITEDGYVLAYRKNGVGYMDSHSYTVLSKPAQLLTEAERAKYAGKGVVTGKEHNVCQYIDTDGVFTVEMPRNAVDEDKDQTCSNGLHFCSYSYLSYFNGDHILVIQIDPADIVAIPSDYNNAKGRCSKYKVLDEITADSQGLPAQQLTQEYAKEVVKPEYATSGMTQKKADEFRKELESGKHTLTSLCEKYGISRRQGARIRDFQAWVE